MHRCALKCIAAFCFALINLTPMLQAQEMELSPSHRWKVFGEYAWASGHYFPNGGDVSGRKWLAVGAGSEWQIKQFGGGSLKYEAEFRPVVLISNIAQTGQNAAQTHLDLQQCPEPSYLITVTCSEIWIYGQQFSPFGLQENFGIRHQLQPIISLNTGYLYTNRPVPYDTSGNFHFTIAVGGGLEYFKDTSGHSISIEAQVQHFSNAYTAATNYGTDNIFLKLSYRFHGRHQDTTSVPQKPSRQ